MKVSFEVTFTQEDLEKIAIAKCMDAHGPVIGGVRGEWVIDHSRYSYGDKDIICRFVPENEKSVRSPLPVPPAPFVTEVEEPL